MRQDAVFLNQLDDQRFLGTDRRHLHDSVPPGLRVQDLARGEDTFGAATLLDVDPQLDAALRTTCVATLLSAGTRVNALPGRASANLNCRILPDSSPAAVQATLVRIIDDAAVEVMWEALERACEAWEAWEEASEAWEACEAWEAWDEWEEWEAWEAWEACAAGPI